MFHHVPSIYIYIKYKTDVVFLVVISDPQLCENQCCGRRKYEYDSLRFCVVSSWVDSLKNR